jgi:hypothetical protein
VLARQIANMVLPNHLFGHIQLDAQAASPRRLACWRTRQAQVDDPDEIDVHCRADVSPRRLIKIINKFGHS